MLRHIVEHADDPRPHVRQAASWALRSIGKRDTACRERALSVAVELLETEDITKRWVGRDAMRELERLIVVPERRRLLNSRSGDRSHKQAPTANQIAIRRSLLQDAE